MGEQVDARTAAARLGVDVRTLYAYVSRGALRRVPGPDGRSSRYDADELDLLARRSRPRTLPRPPASIDLVIATRVSTVADGLVAYRGTDVLELVAAQEPFEAVAELLWGGQLPPGRAPAASAAAVPAALAAALGDETPILRRFAAVVAAGTPGRDVADGAPAEAGQAPDWPAAGRRLIATLVAASGPAALCAGQPAPPGGEVTAVAAELWRRWSPLRPAPARVRALNAALVLVAEHELATSTLAVRVAASARAGPAGCVLAGLGTLSGSRHGDVARLVCDQLRARVPGARPAGFGRHPVHRHGDPRAAPLLRLVSAIAAPADRALIERFTGAAAAPPTVDFALGALCHVARMPSGAATALFAAARTAGWVAHAAEEYAEPALRFRGRAVAPWPGVRRGLLAARPDAGDNGPVRK